MPNFYVGCGVGIALCAAASYVAGPSYVAGLRGAASSRAPRPDSATALAAGEGSKAQVKPRAKGDDAEATAGFVALRRALLTRAVDAPSADPVESPIDLTCKELDERLSNRPANARESARMEQVLRSVIGSGILADTVATVTCGATICRVELMDSDEERVMTSTDALARGASKSFASTVIYPQGTGKRAVYVSSNSEDLRLSARPTNPQVVAPPPKAQAGEAG